MLPALLRDGPASAAVTVILAPGSSEPKDSPLLDALAGGLANGGLAVVRFEFAHMARRRLDGTRRPPARMPALLDEYRAVIESIRAAGPLVIGGRSLGGRVASLLADDVGATGLIAFAYPFHPPREPERLRTAHLETISTPTRIVQGDRDPFGTPEEIAGYPLSSAVEVCFVPDGDHGFVPRKRSGRTLARNVDVAVDLALRFAASVTGIR